MKANWRSTNSPNVVYIDTTMHRVTLTAMEDTTAYPLPTFPEPSDELSDADRDFRARWILIVIAVDILAWLGFVALVYTASK